ncbi:sporulation protein [Mesobacillus harenae]|uniref:sporulation protein n=1 Tax=Mesobacillus harenae TaxID=2213203 RepID=UPI0015801DEB|nr:sporulation protein [Mesobacillus harenae]
MWKEFLSSIGFGSAKVETVIAKEVYKPGDTIKGVVKIHGGNTEQTINKITLSLYTSLEETRDDSDFSFIDEECRHVELGNIGTIHPGEQRSIPIQIPLSANHPITKGNLKTFLRTSLGIPQAVNTTSEDEIIIS